MQGLNNKKTAIVFLSVTLIVMLAGVADMHGGMLSLTCTDLSPICRQGQNASTRSFELWHPGNGTRSYAISVDTAWLSCTPSNGASTGEHQAITVHYNTSDLPAGTHGATITISDPGASNSPQTVSVSLTVYPVFCFAFPCHANPAYRKVQQGQSATATINAAFIAGDVKPVTLSARGMPFGTTCSFRPNPIIPTTDSRMTLTTSASTPAGTYPITVTGTGKGITREFMVTLTVIPASPLNNWKAGDGHIHTIYSDGKNTVEEMVAGARNAGYDWLILTDHDGAQGFQSTCGCLYGTCLKSESDPAKCTNRWNTERDEAIRAGNVHGLRVLTGLEMGGALDHQNTFGHYLAYNIASFIRINYVADVTQPPQKEAAQELINKVNASNNNQGFGFIAHPYSSLEQQSWDFRDVTGYSGFGVAGHPAAINAWVHNLLPKGKRPARIVDTDIGTIGISETDAHTLSTLTRVRTYCLVKGVFTGNALWNALRNGRVVASEGPLLVFTIRGKEIGDVIHIPGDSASLDISWKSNSTWGGVYQISLFVGSCHATQGKVVEGPECFIPIPEPQQNSLEGRISYHLSNLPQEKRYIRLMGVFRGSVDHSAWTNPIWLTSLER